MNNTEVCWDDFVDFCEDNNINLECKDDWEPWFECWEAAIMARIVYDEEQ